MKNEKLFLRGGIFNFEVHYESTTKYNYSPKMWRIYVTRRGILFVGILLPKLHALKSLNRFAHFASFSRNKCPRNQLG